MPDFQKHINKIDSIGWLAPAIFICVTGIYMLTIRMGIIPAILFAGIPFALICMLLAMQKLTLSFCFVFIMNYLVMGINRYYSMKAGLLMTFLALSLLFIVFLQNLYKQQEWERSRTLLVALWGIWFLYCLGEAFNPESLLEPWAIAIPQLAVFPLLFATLVPLLLHEYKHIHWLLAIWAVLTLMGAAKGYWQRNHGFDSTELDWLYNLGGANTHLIHSGIRYFSFFTDAANFGSSMGLSLVTFGISSFYIRNRRLKILFWTAALAGGYGLIISGTRSAIAVPFFGFAFYALACRNIKGILLAIFILASSFILLNYTKIGDSNRLIHRMRTAFDMQDASFLVRAYNKQKIYDEMINKPFGVGLGLGGGKAKRFRPDSPISQIPTDSFLVLLWVETGIIGLLIYLTIITTILYKGTRIVIYEIRNKELRGILLAMLAGICGLIISSYANEVIGFPNGIIIYTFMGIIFAAPYYDKKLTKNEQNT